jgi:YfiH family protein
VAAFVQEGDGMVSFSPDAILAVTVADCLPVFLLDIQNGFLAVLHSGWKGTGIVLNALKILQEAGSSPLAIAAVLGPCIQSCCYRVDEERAKQFDAEFGGTIEGPLGPVTRCDKTGWYIGLQAANARLLTAAGVRHIAYCTDCTFTNTQLGSFRREGHLGLTPFTRMLALAGRVGM